MLSSHSEICIPHEFPLFEILHDFFLNSIGTLTELLDILYSHNAFIDWKINREALAARLLDYEFKVYSVMTSIMIEYIRINYSSKTIWGDKNIGNTAYLFEIKKVFPSAKFIHIVRDVRNVALSLRERRWLRYKFRDQAPHYIKHLKGGVYTWKSALKYVDDFKKSYKSSIYELKYEDLVERPIATLQDVSEFIGVSYEESMLSYSKEAKNTISQRKINDNHANLTKPLLTTEIEKYKIKLSNIEQAIILKLSNRELNSYNFSIDYYMQPSWYHNLWFNLTYQLTRIKYSILYELYSYYKSKII